MRVVNAQRREMADANVPLIFIKPTAVFGVNLINGIHRVLANNTSVHLHQMCLQALFLLNGQ